MNEAKFKKELEELFNSGGTYGGLFIDDVDSEMLCEEIIKLAKQLKLSNDKIIEAN